MKDLIEINKEKERKKKLQDEYYKEWLKKHYPKIYRERYEKN